MRDLLLSLPLSMHFEQARLDQRAPLLATDTFPHDDIHLPALVLEREESDAAGGLRALAHEDDAGCARLPAVRHAAEIARAEELFATQTFAQQRQRMTAQREPNGGVIRNDALSLGRRGEQGPPFSKTPGPRAEREGVPHRHAG